MAKVTVPLKDGVKIGESTFHEVTLRELTPGDIIDASIDSERGLPTESGYAFAISPTLMGINTLLRQIDKIGDFSGPFTVPMLRKFSREDFEVLQLHAEALDQAAMEAVMKRGRTDASGSDAGMANDEVLPTDQDAP